MEQVVPWARLVEQLRPLYPKGERGRPPVGLERMLRIYFLQQWYGLADEALEDALYDSQALRGMPRLLTALERTRLLIIDDWGPEPLNTEQRRDLLEIVDDRCDRGSLLITSQVPVSRWHEVIGDPTLADAILDRIVHRAHRIQLKGPSLRRRLVAAESPTA